MRNQVSFLATVISMLVSVSLPGCAPDTDLQPQATNSTGTESDAGSLSSATTDAESGQLVEPPSGTIDMPTNLARVVLRFTEPVAATGSAPAILLRPASGDALGLPLGQAVPCDATCYQVPISTALAPSTLHSVEVAAGALRFLDGKPVPAGGAGAFTTGDAADSFVPRLTAFTVQVAEGCLVVHVAADEVVSAEIQISAAGQVVTVQSSSFAAILDWSERVSTLPTATSGQAIAVVQDRAGNTATSTALAIDLPPALPNLVITEVLANPAGSETTQEWVEIYNAGDAPIDLGGLVISDKTGGDILPTATLPAGGFGLVVSEKFNVSDGVDTTPRVGTLLLPVSGRIGGDGLANTGELVRLSTSDGHVISQYGGWVDVSASSWSGKSVKRAPIAACDAPSAWSTTPSPATPGW